MRSLLVVICLAFALPVLAEPSLKKTSTDDELIDMLETGGNRAVEVVKDRVISVKVDGTTFVLYAYKDDDLQLYYGVTGFEIGADAINDWNRTRRLSRAYLDDEGDPVLEADLLANAGSNTEQFLEWLEVFAWSAVEFRRFLVDNDNEE